MMNDYYNVAIRLVLAHSMLASNDAIIQKRRSCGIYGKKQTSNTGFITAAKENKTDAVPIATAQFSAVHYVYFLAVFEDDLSVFLLYG